MHLPLIVLIALSCFPQIYAQPGIPGEVPFDGAKYRPTELYRHGGDFLHVEYFPAGQTSRPAAKSIEFFRQPLSTDRLDQLIKLHLETLNQWTPKGVLTVLEKSNDHLALKDVRFDGTLSGSPLFVIYIYDLEGRTLLSSQFMFHPRYPFDTPESFSKEITQKQAAWLKDLRELSRAVHKELAKEANKDGAANGGQPIRSETNSTPSAVGSRR